jgi:hypothetical protein
MYIFYFTLYYILICIGLEVFWMFCSDPQWWPCISFKGGEYSTLLVYVLVYLLINFWITVTIFTNFNINCMCLRAVWTQYFSVLDIKSNSMAYTPTYEVRARLNIGNGCGVGCIFRIETCSRYTGFMNYAWNSLFYELYSWLQTIALCLPKWV